MGIYDINQKKVIFEPQFYDVDFLDDGWIRVEVYDEALGRRIQKIIDLNGNEKFHSVYSYIYASSKHYEVTIHDKNGHKRGLIDEYGNVILPCEYDIAWNGILFDKKRFVYKDGEKCGIMDFDGNIIVPPIYYEIFWPDKPLITVRVGEKDNYSEGLINSDGTVVIPADYHDIKWLGDNYIACCDEGHCEMMRYTLK